jgi:hypothetical protein
VSQITATTSAERPNRFLRVFLAAFLVLSALSTAWAIATPVAAAPDEPAHMIKAASVVRGEFIGEYTPTGHRVHVPQYIAYTNAQAACYAFKAEQSAECIPPIPGDESEIVETTTTAGLYNPLYYLIVGWPSLIAPDASGMYAMRIVSGVAVSLLLGLAVALVSRWRRPVLPMLGLLVAMTPMVLFLNGTVNPNSMENAAVLTTFVAMMTIVRQPDHPRFGWLAAIVVVSATIAANMRGLSLLWVAVAVLAPLILLGKDGLVALFRRRAVIVAVVATAVTAAFAAVWLLSTNSLNAGVAAGVVPPAPGVGSSPVTGFVRTLIDTFNYGEGIIGIFGWLDTPAPLYVYFTWSLFIGAALLLSFVLVRGRAFWLSMVLFASLALLPPLIQGYYITGGGVIWQGRYILPVFVCAIMAAAAGLSERTALSKSSTDRLVVAVVVLWATSQLYSFASALRRYVSGIDEGWGSLLSPEWAPPGGVFPVLGLFAVAVAAAAVALVLWARGRSAHSQTDAVDTVAAERVPSA